jgi:hypothetical protein
MEPDIVDNASTEQLVEAGFVGDALPLWQAREAVRHAELRLASQASTLQAFETRATAILGWIALIVSTLAGGVIVSLDAHRPWRALAFSAAFVPALIAALYASRLLWPKRWNVPGFDPITVRSPCESELDQLQWLSDGYATGIAENAEFLALAGDRVRVAWWALLAAPFVAGLGFVIIWVLGV